MRSERCSRAAVRAGLMGPEAMAEAREAESQEARLGAKLRALTDEVSALTVPEGASEAQRAALHPDVDALTFTGSTHTGKKLLIAAGSSNMKRLVLECGGKSPHIVFDDCPDLAAADAILVRAFWNQGQVCTASSLLLVHRGVQNELLRILVRKDAGARSRRPAGD